MSSIYPVGYRVLVKPDPLEEMSEGGILIARLDADAEKAATTVGTMVALGKEAWNMHENRSPWAEVGDRVYYAKYAGKRVVDPESKEEYLILNDEDILGVITNG